MPVYKSNVFCFAVFHARLDTGCWFLFRVIGSFSGTLKQSQPSSEMSEHPKDIVFDNSVKSKLLQEIKVPSVKPPCKITVVGCGMVGMACSISILIKKLATDVVIMDVIEDKLKGELLDLNHGKLFLSNVNITGCTKGWKIGSGGKSVINFTELPICEIRPTDTHRPYEDSTSDYSLTAGSKIVIVTAGARQKVGESRLGLVQRNVDIFKHIIPQIAKNSPDAIIIVVSNPVDIMTYVTWKLSNFPRHRVIGSGTNLDSARFRHIIADHLEVSPSSVHGIIIGEHGDSSVPLWSEVSVAGRSLVSIDSKIGQSDGPKGWDQIHKKVVDGAHDVIRLKGYTNWAIGLSCSEIVSAILHNTHVIQPVSCFVKGQAGIENDVCLSLPCVMSACGVVSIVQINLKPNEQAALLKSAELINKIQQDLKW